MARVAAETLLPHDMIGLQKDAIDIAGGFANEVGRVSLATETLVSTPNTIASEPARRETFAEGPHAASADPCGPHVGN